MPHFLFVVWLQKEYNMEIKKQVENAILLYEQQNIPALQQQLYELYINFNKKGGGQLIINYPDKYQLAICFILMLEYDWEHDSDIREVWAENGFYCIIEYLNKQTKSTTDIAMGAQTLFLHLCIAREDLKPMIQKILNKAVVLGATIFKDHFINNKADYLIDQFLYLSALMSQPLIELNKNTLQPEQKKIFDDVLSNKNIEIECTANSIIEKASFIASAIGSILEDM